MRRRRLLTIGAASAALLLVAGGVTVALRPAFEGGRLAAPGRAVFAACARALLDGTLPAEPAAREAALSGLLVRIEALIAALPAHAQQELSQLLSLLASDPGRGLFAGVPAQWDEASVAQIASGLQAMRLSSLALRQQGYQALHDIVAGAYFSDPATWPTLGYPGPAPI